MSVLPAVSVILAVRNEERDLRASLAGILAQQYDGEWEVVVAVGPSDDRTREIADEIAKTHSRVRVVDNPRGITPAGLNAALAAARHDLIVRVDGHAHLVPGYLARVVDVLTATEAANVGGPMLAEGVTPFEQAVARAMSSRLGIGGVSFHTGGEAGPAQTVYLGSFRREALDAVGGFDEDFVRAQDWELNYRLRQSGYVVWFDPSLGVGYRPRGSLRALARQFYRTGRWRRFVMKRYPDTASVRYLAPPLAVASVTAGTVVGVTGAVGLVAGASGMTWLLLGFALPVGYALGILGGTAVVGRGLSPRARAWLPLVVATMHGAWGVGFLKGPE